MKKTLLSLIAALLAPGASAQQGTEGQATAQQTMQRLELRAKELISQMTLEEKFSQMMNEAPGIQRLGIEAYDWWNEGLHGVGRNGRATVFPQPIGLAATFHPELIQQIGDAIASEARAKYGIARKNGNYARYTGLTFWSPNINILRDPRWGRCMETWGEDPFLTGTMGSAFVRGMQGNDPVYLKVAACGKHFAAHSGPEMTRHTANVEPSQRDLWETYLPAFRTLVQEAKVEIIMGAYNRVYSESASASKRLLTDILRKQWGFKGHIVSDCGAVRDVWREHKIVKTPAEACAVAVKAGLNIECGTTFKALKEALAQGLLTEQDIDHALMPLMMTRLKLGIIDQDKACPYNNTSPAVIGCQQHRALARQAARESMVLLKNNGVLPLKKDMHTLYVTGAGAADAFWLMGNYYGVSDHYSTYLQGIVAKAGEATAVNYRPGVLENSPALNAVNWAVGEARGAECAIVVMGNNGNLEGEEGEAIDSERGDRKDLRIPESQMNYLRRICKDKRNHVVVVLTGGSAMDVREVAELADAVVLAWYAGQEGGDALAELLFGEANFSGRLPLTFPADGDLLPPFDDYSMKERTYKYMTGNIFYPFGYGLSYGRVTYGNISVKADRKRNAVRATLALSNDSDWEIDELVQCYATTPEAGFAAPLQQLVAFQRVNMKPHSTKVVRFDIPAERLMTVGEDGKSRLVKGQYVVTASSAALSHRTAALGIQQVSANIDLPF